MKVCRDGSVCHNLLCKLREHYVWLCKRSDNDDEQKVISYNLPVDLKPRLKVGISADNDYKV